MRTTSKSTARTAASMPLASHGDQDATPSPRETNLAQLFRNRTARYGDMLRWRQRQGHEQLSVTYRENQRMVNRVLSGIDALGARPGDAIGILSATRWEWLVTDWAIIGLGAYTTTLFPNLLPETVLFILRDSGVRYLFVENARQYEKVRSVRAELPRLEKIIIFEEDAEVLADPMVISFSTLLTLSPRSDDEAEAFAAACARDIPPDACAGLIYTSGTTGMPKGVVHTHRMLLSVLACVRTMLTTVHPGIVDALFVPLSHGMGRLEHLFTFEFGGETVIIPSLTHLARDIREAQPDMLLAVPRVYEKAYATIAARVAAASPLERALFDWAVRRGTRAVPLRQERHQLPYLLRLELAVADRLVFRRLRAAFGGRLQLAISGGAPIDPAVVTFFDAIGIPLLEAWGLTESTTVLTVNQVDRFRVGTVGTVFPGHEIRIAPDGEILARGPCIFSCYHNNPEATAEALDAEGWLHTGDIGTLDRDGFLTIIDRKKDLIVTPSGEKLAPQRLEALLGSSPLVAQACAYGDRKPHIVALLTLEWDAVRAWAAERGLGTSNIRSQAQSPQLRAYMDEQLKRVNSQLAPFERVKRYAILSDDFTVENGLLTPTQKIRRKDIYKRYHDQFEQLYQAPSASAPPEMSA